MAPRTRPEPQGERRRASAQLPREVQNLLNASIEASERGEGIDLTEQEAERYYETGELPERVQHAGKLWADQWHASRG